MSQATWALRNPHLGQTLSLIGGLQSFCKLHNSKWFSLSRLGSRSWSLCHVVSSISMFCTLGHSAGLFVSRSEVYSLFFCKPHNSRDLSWQCVVRWPLPLGISLTFRIVPLRVQSGRCGHLVLSLGTVRFKQPGMRPTPVPQKKKWPKKIKPKKKRPGLSLAMSTAARAKMPVQKKKSFSVDSGTIAWSRLNVCG